METILKENLTINNPFYSFREELNKKYDILREQATKEYSKEKLYQDPDNIQWIYVTCWVSLTEEEMREFSPYLIRDFVKDYQKCSKDFLREFDLE